MESTITRGQSAAESSRSSGVPGTLRLSEVVSALSYALDITEGQPEGHAVRSCMIGMRLAREIYLLPKQRSSLFYALLLEGSRLLQQRPKITPPFRCRRLPDLRDPSKPALVGKTHGPYLVCPPAIAYSRIRCSPASAAL